MSGRGKIALIVAGVVIGAIVISPSGAHISNSVEHLWNKHLKGKVAGLTYTKRTANSLFYRGSWSEFSRPFQDTNRQAVGAPFSIYCDNDPASAQLEYEAPEDVRVIIDYGASSAQSLMKEEGQTHQPPPVTGFGTQLSTWIIVTENSYTRYMVSLTVGAGNCHGTIETIRAPAS